jgi:hypothetical protein
MSRAAPVVRHLGWYGWSLGAKTRTIASITLASGPEGCGTQNTDLGGDDGYDDDRGG